MENNYSIEIDKIDYSINLEKQDYIIEIDNPPDIEINLNKQGPPGVPGNGIASIEIIEETEEYTVYRINYTDPDMEPYDYTVYNGRNLEPSEEYVFEQAISSSEWVIQHNLNCHPSITVVDLYGSVVDGDWEYVDSNNIILHFTAPFGGTAYLNYTR